MIKLLSALKKLTAENCFILTFNLDLSFFEAALFEPLYAAGCRNTTILCDPQQYHFALEDANIIRFAGQRYLLFSGQTSPQGAFHPKLILLTNKTAGHLLITSGNLSRSGYTHNWEVATEFEFNSRRPDPTAWQAFRWSIDFLRRLASDSDRSGLVQERLDQIMGTTPWLRDELPLSENAPVWLLQNLDFSLIEQIASLYRQIDGSPVKEVLIVSPFFDPGALAFAELLEQFNPTEIKVFTQTAQGLQKEAINRVLQRHSANVTFHLLTNMSRRLHAKALLLKTTKGVWLVSGSANFSSPALLHVARRGNTEVVVVRHESQMDYYDQWLEELTSSSLPVSLESLQTELQTVPDHPNVFELKLLSVNLRQKELELILIPEPDPKSNLRLLLGDDKKSVIEVSEWKRTSTGVISLPCPYNILQQADSPLLISVELIRADGNTLQSRPLLLHNLNSLERYSRPPRQANRPSIPDGLITENEEQCAQLLEMIHGLLITNQEQLAHHNPRIVSQRRREQEEVEIPEEYNPDEHIVSEPIRRPVSGLMESDELYVDYDERLTYQELLNAVLSAAYQPQSGIPVDSSTSTSNLLDSSLTKTIVLIPPLTNQESINRVRARISSGFKRLVDNFLQGLADSEYMGTVSATYLLELWTIIAAYLRIVWRNGMLPDELFQEHSLALLYAYWGKPVLPGAWQTIKVRFTEVEKTAEFHRLSVPLNLWLHVAAVIKSLEHQQDRRRYDVAGWIRMFCDLEFSPLVITEFDASTYKRLWLTSFPTRFEFIPADDLVRDLLRLHDEYDEVSLKDEINAQAGALPTLGFENIAGERRVPCLFLKLPLSNQLINHYWNIFRLFLFQPQLKPLVWARFENTNPVISERDIFRITVFFRSDRQSLLFSVERKNGESDPDIYQTNISTEKIKRIDNIFVLMEPNPPKDI